MESVDSEALTGTSQAKADLAASAASADLAASAESAESVASAASRETSPSNKASEEPEELLASLELMVSAKRRMQLLVTMVPDLLAPALLDSDSKLVELDQALALILAVLI